ncbi:sodium:calcium antiporter [Arthrospiribacter ruber]|uniref:Sodium/calcium exchanger membrane region domain-containing protein n=1 Tax=Arthrospiribacter ruber TaxID=2487934 RepID=A0A951IXM9_9BACT|nr:hypothetical protein [Arthrospiribacter ruber]MBW3467927.1 hypothetical protein [Arthrospiribacter ruber]
MIVEFALVILGFVSLIFGASWLVDGASSLAKKYRVSDLIIGLTIVAFGTSAPELVVNIIGSNIFNILLILSISGIIQPFEYNPKFNLDLYMLIGGTFFLLTTMLTGQKKSVDRWESGALMLTYIIYTTYLVLKEF